MHRERAITALRLNPRWVRGGIGKAEFVLSVQVLKKQKKQKGNKKKSPDRR